MGAIAGDFEYKMAAMKGQKQDLQCGPNTQKHPKVFLNFRIAPHIRHLPVVENNKVVGIVSIGDLVKNIIEMQGNQINFLETYIKGHSA